MPLRHRHRRKDTAVLGGVLTDDLQAPGLHRGSGGVPEALVAGKDACQPLVHEHGDCFAEPVEQIRRRRVGEKASLVVAQHRLPIPIGARQAGRLRRGQRLVADRIEAEARRQHKALL